MYSAFMRSIHFILFVFLILGYILLFSLFCLHSFYIAANVEEVTIADVNNI